MKEKMVLVDLSAILIASIMMTPEIKNNVIDENIIRHMALVSLKNYKANFDGEYVICCDGNWNWRFKYFKHYKANRRLQKAKSTLDWKEISRIMNLIHEELRDNFPYKVVKIDGAEADDVIATLTRTNYKTKDITIISGDKDFKQLARYEGVKQFSPREKEYIEVDNPQYELIKMIIEGDRGDGVPNCLSPGDSFVSGIRQKTLTKNIKDVILSNLDNPTASLSEEYHEYYDRNRRLIDLRCTPKSICEEIIDSYNEPVKGSNKTIYNYFIEKRLKNLMEDIQHFY